MKLVDIQERIRKDPKWGYLDTMMGEPTLPRPTAGVNHRGLLLVNPELAGQLSSAVLINRVRDEFITARKIRKVRGF